MLAEQVKAASPEEYERLRAGTYEIVWPIVFNGLTRSVERQRGHHECAKGVDHLEPDCLDRYQDDVEAVLHDVLRNVKIPIRNLEGWIRSRLTTATIDGHRRRRGERGALQRPRMPKWLARRLDDDPWLIALALDIQAWVGIPATAGASVWPYGAWADHRTAVTGNPTSTEQEVAREVETVLTAMRHNRDWYETYIERPLGHKQAPVLPPAVAAADLTSDRPPLALTQRHESDDALLRELAAVAIDAIAARLGRGWDLPQAVQDVIGTVFGSGTGTEYLSRLPGAGCDDDDRVRALLSDALAVDRLVAEVRDILGVPDA